MPDGLSLTYSGFKGLQAALAELPKRVASKGMRVAADKAAAPVLAEAKRTAPRGDTKALRRSLGKKLVRIKGKTKGGSKYGWNKTTGYSALVGARKNQVGVTKSGSVRVPSRYLHLVEKGTATHALKTTGNLAGLHPGVRRRPFLANALRNNRHRSEAIAATVFRTTVTSEAIKLRSKG